MKLIRLLFLLPNPHNDFNGRNLLVSCVSAL